jgi:protein SCO1/2
MEDKIDQLTEETHEDRTAAEARSRDGGGAQADDGGQAAAPAGAAQASTLGPTEVFAFLIGFVVVAGLVLLAAWAGGLLPGGRSAAHTANGRAAGDSPLASRVFVERDAIAYPVADFSFVDQDGQPFGRGELLGRWWVAGFIFTNCASTCPPMTVAMRRIQDEIADLPADAAHLVFFSVDPDNDTPAVLRAFGQRNGADFARWTFLTGDREEIWGFARGSFRLGVGDDPLNAPEPILHSRRFALVDPEGNVVRFLDGLAPDEVAELISLLREKAAAR